MCSIEFRVGIAVAVCGVAALSNMQPHRDEHVHRLPPDDDDDPEPESVTDKVELGRGRRVRTARVIHNVSLLEDLPEASVSEDLHPMLSPMILKLRTIAGEVMPNAL